ncbi:MAG TPA: AAA family ATPase [Acidimicrobiia bacterium]|nr:AAA family ATPase [Acidimicrobiia bacterium]
MPGAAAAAGARLAETHSAVVVLLGDRAYKLKKPVDLGFLDFSTREARERMLRRELELNRRLAPDVYLGVADVLGPDGSCCDHLLVMRRMPDDRRLAALVRAGRVTDEEVREIARTVAAFHARAERNEEIARAGTPEVVACKLERDLADLEPHAGRILPDDAFRAAAAMARRYLAGRHPLLAARVRAGCICDGHGDLLADDVFCLTDGPRVLDCIEFDDTLRYGDVLADVAFLAMDLERLGAPELGARFLGWYGEFSGEHHPATLADYYVAFRALIRSKVACVRAAQGDAPATGEARRLLDLAVGHLRRGRVRVVLVGGSPGTGKTTLARGIAEAQGWALLRSDVIRKELAGLPEGADTTAALRAGLYTEGATAATYEELAHRARRALEYGENVVLDASWARVADRRRLAEIAAATASHLVELRCDAPAALAEARIAGRRAADHDASDVTVDVARVLRTEADPWPGAAVVPTDGPEPAALARALAVVTS